MFEPISFQAKDVERQQDETGLPATGFKFFKPDSAHHYAAEPIDVLEKESAEAEDSRPIIHTPETAYNKKSELTSEDFDETANPERSPKWPTATLAHDQATASFEESVSDNVLNRSQEVKLEDPEFEFLPVIEPVSKAGEASKEECDTHDEFDKHTATSRAQTAGTGQSLHDADRTENKSELVASKERKFDEEGLLDWISEEDEDIQVLPLLSVENRSAMDGGKDKVIAGRQDKGPRESASKNAPSEPAPAAVAEKFQGSGKHDAASGKRYDDTTNTEEQIPFDLPLIATKVDTDDDLQHIFVSRGVEEEAFDHGGVEQSRTKGIKPFNKDEEPVTEDEEPVTEDEEPIGKNVGPIAKNEKPIAKKETPIAKNQEESQKKEKKGKKGNRAKKEPAAEEDESASLADKAAYLLENIKEAI